MNSKKINIVSALAFLLAMPAIALADIVTTIGCKIENAVWIAFGVAAVVYFLWYGIMFLTAAGDASKVSTARQGVLWGIVGVVVGVLAIGIVSFVVSYFGIGGTAFTC